MSDKNRNMNGINDQKTIDRTEQAALDQTAEQRAFSEEIRRRLAEPDSGKPTLEEFKLLVYKDRERRRKKRSAMAACIVVACLAGCFAFDQLVPEVGADKNPKETIQTEDGVIIEDGGYGSSEEEDNVWVTEDWANVEDARELYPMLIVPKYVPEGYVFSGLTIDNFVRNDITAEYSFACESRKLYIEMMFTDNGQVSLQVENVSSEISSKRGKIFLQEQINTATIQLDDGRIVIINADLAKEEIVKIIENLES